MPLKHLLVAVLFLFASTTGLTQSNDELVDQFQRAFDDVLLDKGIPGGAYAIVSGDGIIEIGTRGFTSINQKQAVNANTIFRIASVSKTFAAHLAGQLVEEGKFYWEDPITRHVPDFRINGDTSQIQVGHVIGQSTGLVPHAYDQLIEEDLSLDRIYKKFRNLSPICNPGECYSYQNTIYSLIQPVIENATGRPYADLMQQRIFKPLSMTTASVGYQPYLDNPNRAEPHKLQNGHWRSLTVTPNYYRIAPAAGVNASVTDMARWLMAQLGSNPEVIKPQTIDTLTQQRVRTKREFGRRYWRDYISDAHYGLGWRIYTLGEEKIIYHSGWVAGFRADIGYSADRNIGLVILLNGEGSSISRLSTEFWGLVFNS